MPSMTLFKPPICNVGLPCASAPWGQDYSTARPLQDVSLQHLISTLNHLACKAATTAGALRPACMCMWTGHLMLNNDLICTHPKTSSQLVCRWCTPSFWMP